YRLHISVGFAQFFDRDSIICFHAVRSVCLIRRKIAGIRELSPWVWGAAADFGLQRSDSTLRQARQNAGRSSGLREVTRFLSTTTSASSQLAPAFTTSSL